MNFNENYQTCLKYICDHDLFWMKRRRKLDTEAIFKYLVKGSILNTGISTCVNLDNNFSHVAMIKARRKLHDNLFYNINSQMHQEYILKNHVYAIDGSKVPVNYGFKKKYGYLSRTCDKVIRRPAKRPLAMLSALTGHRRRKLTLL